MAGKSEELTVIEARDRIKELNSEEEILEFVDGDGRIGVIRAVNKRLSELSDSRPKQGQVTKFTDSSRDFKGPGVEGKKEKGYVTCEDVIKTLRQKGVKI